MNYVIVVMRYESGINPMFAMGLTSAREKACWKGRKKGERERNRDKARKGRRDKKRGEEEEKG